MTAIAVATMSIVILFSVLEGMRSDLVYNLTTFYTGEVQIRHSEYGTYEHLNPLHLSVDDVPRRLEILEATEGVATAVPRLTVSGAVFRDDERTPLQAVGVDFHREAAYSAISDYIVAGDAETVTEGARASSVASAPRITPVIVGRGVPERLGADLGDQFTLVVRTATRGTNAMTFRIAAVADFPVAMLNEGVFWAPLERIQRLARMPDQVGEILVKLDPSTGSAAATASVTDALRDALRDTQPDLEVRHFSDISTTYSFIEMATTMYNIIALFFFVLASTVIVNTTMMVIFERRREIGTLEAMGMHGRELLRMFLSEAVILGVLGAAAGLVLGVAVVLVLGRTGIDFGASMEGVDMEVSSVLRPVLNLRSTAVVFVFSVIVSSITSYFPTRRITRIEPVAALREE
jgi:putative ABC transport system permease protein